MSSSNAPQFHSAPQANGSKGWAVLAAGGSGQRFSASCKSGLNKPLQANKLLVSLHGEPVFVHALRLLLESQFITGVVVVAAPEALGTYQAIVEQAIVEQTLLPQNKTILWQTGGATRRASVLCGLQMLQAQGHLSPWVLVHDAARPMLRPCWVDALCHQAEANPQLQGLLLGYPVKDTLKQSAAPLPTACCTEEEAPPLLLVEQTTSREQLWQVQTPQWFKTEALLKAHTLVPETIAVTDDAQLLELAQQGPVALMVGPCDNLKLTTAQDLTMAEALWPVRQSHT